MGTLRTSMSVSLDGFVSTPEGSLDWVRIDEALHTAFNDDARGTSAFVYGRRMYELMTAYWPTAHEDPDATPAMLDFAAIWRATPILVASRTLTEVGPGARLLGDDAVSEIARLRAEPGFDMGAGGPTLVGDLWRAGLVDEVSVYVHPVLLGAGTPMFPPLRERIGLRLTETRAFDSGVVGLRYVPER